VLRPCIVAGPKAPALAEAMPWNQLPGQVKPAAQRCHCSSRRSPIPGRRCSWSTTTISPPQSLWRQRLPRHRAPTTSQARGFVDVRRGRGARRPSRPHRSRRCAAFCCSPFLTTRVVVLGNRQHGSSVAAVTEQCNPVRRESVGRTGDRLVLRMAFRRSEFRPVVVLVRVVVPEPVFARLERPDDGMSGFAPVRGGMPGQRIIATPDVSACRAAAQVHPPATNRVTLGATCAAGQNRGVDGCTHSWRAYRRAIVEPGALQSVDTNR
jgi:hypothetical protein